MNMTNIPFNKPFLTGKEAHYMYQAVYSGKISGNGMFTKKCHQFFEEKYGFKKCLLTTSCTDALEMAAILCNVEPGDEVIVPSYTFVSSALAFVRQGAKIVFADSYSNNPNIDADMLEELITPRTKVIVPVHYAGVACDMDKIMEVAHRHNILVVEDAAQAIDSYYKGRPLGSIGHLGCFSFHETKNINSGEGGLLTINDEQFARRAEIIWEKGTNRAEFFRGEINKYGWVDTGSSFLPSEIIAAYLWAQLENIDDIQKRRISIWNKYNDGLQEWAIRRNIKTPLIPKYASNNAHMYYLICESENQRSKFIEYLKAGGIHAVFHYQSLHKSSFYLKHNESYELVYTDNFSERLVRLPLFYELSDLDTEKIIQLIKSF